MRCLAIIPTYNEKENIAGIIERIIALGAGFDILVIDDGSPDGTGDVVAAISELNPSVKLLRRPGKVGLASAYITGFGYALDRGYDAVFTMDADFSHNPDYMPKMLDKLSDSDYVVGSRYVAGGGTRGWPLRRKIISRFGNIYARAVTDIGVRDLTSGFACIKTEVLRSVGISDIKTEGYGFLIEMKYRSSRAGFKVSEYPIIFTDRAAGKSKISKSIIFEAMLLVWKLRFS
ncbi:MAG: polyprenol monophosphomannose synthase [Endomicrobiia bacterium]|nr:polyprenol monophosphomannose synthase [Endomicrobiia bacterium]